MACQQTKSRETHTPPTIHVQYLHYIITSLFTHTLSGLFWEQIPTITIRVFWEHSTATNKGILGILYIYTIRGTLRIVSSTGAFWVELFQPEPEPFYLFPALPLTGVFLEEYSNQSFSIFPAQSLAGVFWEYKGILRKEHPNLFSIWVTYRGIFGRTIQPSCFLFPDQPLTRAFLGRVFQPKVFCFFQLSHSQGHFGSSKRSKFQPKFLFSQLSHQQVHFGMEIPNPKLLLLIFF